MPDTTSPDPTPDDQGRDGELPTAQEAVEADPVVGGVGSIARDRDGSDDEPPPGATEEGAGADRTEGTDE